MQNTENLVNNMDLIFHKKLVTHPKILISLVFIVISIFFTLSNSAGGEINEISIESLYKRRQFLTGEPKGIIDVEKYRQDQVFYLRTNSTQKDIVYLKMGRENQPFSLNIRTLKIEVSSEEEWGKAKDELMGDFFKTGGFVDDKGKLQNVHTNKIIKPSGEHILKYSASSDNKLVFIYSFSGWYREVGPFGAFGPPPRKLGVNYFEIWNLEKDEKIFSDSKISSSISYGPHLEFWLDDRRVMIFTNNFDKLINKSLFIIQY